MADTTSALPGPDAVVVDRFRKWSPIWYPWIKKLLETIRTEAAARFEITQTVDEISGKYTIDLTEDGIQRGAIKLDGSGTISEIGLLADRVVVYKPDGTGGKAVFALGTVNGAAGYGLGALMVLDGAIVARHIDVDSLSAIAADIGTITAGVLKSADNKFVIDLNNKTLTIST
jgi:hypothetical protein